MRRLLLYLVFMISATQLIAQTPAPVPVTKAVETITAADDRPEERYFYRSDQYSFARKEFPVFSFQGL